MEPLDEAYLVWLYSQFSPVRLKNPSRTYWSLAKVLFETEFTWFISNDDNRVEDGRSLREEFLQQEGVENPDLNWLGLGCSMLEMLVALSRRLSFETDRPADDWMWHLLENIDLHRCNDRAKIPGEEILKRVSIVIDRRYEYDGRGGLFPLHEPQQDQREVEIWYQMCAYLLELE